MSVECWLRKIFPLITISILQPKRKEFVDFWDGFEAQCSTAGLSSKVPACMKKLLTICGYNSAWSFKALTEESLADLEGYIENNHRKDADEFAEYKDIKPFKFLPGHRALIFGIKSDIADFENTKRPRKDVKKKPPVNEVDIQANLLNQLACFTSKLNLQADWSNSNSIDSILLNIQWNWWFY